MALIEVKNLSFSYEGQEDIAAVDSVNLSIEQGSWVSIIGHNGSGKSTLIKLLNGLFLPSAGEVLVDGISTTDEQRIWELRRRVGMIFQNPDNQLVATVVEEDVAFGLENLGVPPVEIQRRVRAALEAVSMEQFAQSAPHRLSGGQKQRIGIAGVLAMEPDVLLMDEPTAMLDPSGRKEVMQTVRRLHEERGITVVHVTHFMEEALVADVVHCMDEGRVVLSAPPKALFSNHISQLKALGLEVPPMTELAARLKNRGLAVDTNITTVEEMVSALCQLKSSI